MGEASPAPLPPTVLPIVEKEGTLLNDRLEGTVLGVDEAIFGFSKSVFVDVMLCKALELLKQAPTVFERLRFVGGGEVCEICMGCWRIEAFDGVAFPSEGSLLIVLYEFG